MRSACWCCRARATSSSPTTTWPPSARAAPSPWRRPRRWRPIRRFPRGRSPRRPCASPRRCACTPTTASLWRKGDMEPPPREIVAELDKYVGGQKAAKRAVAVALRNRWRRQKLPEGLREEISPKNVLMIGPTGVGKAEIARRLARLVNAPFVKVEATKFTEVGYVGRDVESMIRDLVETAVRMVKAERMEEVAPRAEKLANDRLLDYLAPLPKKERPVNPLGALF